MTDALEFLSAYKNEDNYTVLVEIATGLSKLSKILAGTDLSPQLDKFTRNLFSPLAEKLTWNKKPNENYSDALLRPLALSMAGESGDEAVIREAKNKFNSLMRGAHVEPDIRGTVYRLAVMNGGIKEYNFLINKYKSEPLHEEKNRIGSALGSFKDKKILKQVCEFALSKDVRVQDVVGIISVVGANPNGREIWLSFIMKNWKILVSQYGDGGHTLSRIVKAISSSAKEKHFKTFKKFFTIHDAPGAKRSIEQVLERLEGNILWLKRDKKIIEKFLKQI